MLAAIRSAARSVRLESYIFAAADVGWEFARALAEGSRAGIEVRVQIDAVGSLLWASRDLDRYLRKQGVQLRWFHRWRWRRPLRYNRRNYRKLLVVDGSRAFLGGFNIHRENSRRRYGEKRWRDTHVGPRGSLAEQAAALFAREDSIEAAWAAVDPVLTNHRPAVSYTPGSWGPKEADTLIVGGSWHDPVPEGAAT